MTSAVAFGKSWFAVAPEGTLTTRKTAGRHTVICYKLMYTNAVDEDHAYVYVDIDGEHTSLRNPPQPVELGRSWSLELETAYAPSDIIRQGSKLWVTLWDGVSAYSGQAVVRSVEWLVDRAVVLFESTEPLYRLDPLNVPEGYIDMDYF